MVNWSELSIFISAIAGCVVSILIATQKSKCTKISLLGGCCECERKNILADDLESQLSNVQEDPQTTKESSPEDEATDTTTTTSPRESTAHARYEDAIRRSGTTYRLPETV